VLVTQGHGLAWAWTGVSVEWAADLTADRSFSELDEPSRVRKALAEQQAWLESLLGQEGVILDARWLWRPNQSQLRLRLLARVQRHDVETARAAAIALLDRISAVPPQVGLGPLSDAEIASSINPIEKAQQRYGSERPRRSRIVRMQVWTSTGRLTRSTSPAQTGQACSTKSADFAKTWSCRLRSSPQQRTRARWQTWIA
jgi:hypothetical protein